MKTWVMNGAFRKRGCKTGQVKLWISHRFSESLRELRELTVPVPTHFFDQHYVVYFTSRGAVHTLSIECAQFF